jgi:ATP-dependent DNA helicase RecG
MVATDPCVVASPHVLQSLVRPLRYACERDFELLEHVRDLGTLLRSAVAAAQAHGLDGAGLAALRAEVEDVDHPQPTLRKASLRRVADALRQLGVTLPPELAALADAAEPRARPLKQRGPRQAPLEGPSEESGRRAPRDRRAESERPDSSPDVRAEARLLSIAPRAGPLATPLRAVGWRINPRLLSALERKEVRKVGDVLFLLPRVYEDRRRIRRIIELVPGERGVTLGVVQSAGESYGRRRMFRAVVADETGRLDAKFFHSGPWLKARFPLGRRLVLSGELRASPSGREMVHPEVEPADDLEHSPIHFHRIVPIYPGFERHEQRQYRELASKVSERYAEHLEDPLPTSLRERLQLMPLAESIRRIHFPRDEDDLEELDRHLSPAHRRLAFDELFFVQLGMALKRRWVKVQPGIAFDVSEPRLTRAKALVPFALTRAQTRVVGEIARDLGRPEPMNRLLQGDVGSGKTAVALITASVVLQGGYQVAVMAPTEILAEQHFRTFQRLGREGEVGLVSAGGTARQKREVRDALARGEIRCAVGTHALIEEGVEFDRLGLVVIDEQHRFGVIQRRALMSKGRRPDVLVMTATPIPRTLAMTLYGDLDLSVLDELPPGRTPIHTRVFSERQRTRVYDAMRAELEKGRQAYVVYPLVEESEKVDLADATQGAEALRAVFPQYEVGLLHGRMKQGERDAVMCDFRDGRIHLLVSTTVIEVGVDVPNAAVMVIEHAERFGLSQLHQLRGRVGRGAAASHCFLVAGYARSKEASDRLGVMQESTDGFVIAEKDLEIRGPGEILGTRQSGVPELAVANLARDGALNAQARAEALSIVELDPELRSKDHQMLVRALEERWQGRLSLARVG